MNPIVTKNNPWRLVRCIGWGTLLTAYGSSAVTSVLPLIAHDFGCPTAKAKEVVTFYLFALCALLPAAGRLGDRIGFRRFYLGGIALSFLGALLCALAPTLGWLALFRIIEGAGTACILSGGMATITRHGAFRQRGILLSWASTMAYIGLALTPAFSGWLAGAFGWRAIFLAHLPLSAWAFLSAVRILPADTRSSVSIAPRRPLRSPIFPNLRPVLYASAAAMLAYTALYGLSFVLPVYLFDTRNLRPEKAGLILSVKPALTALSAPLGGMLADRYGVYKPQWTALLLLLAAFIALAHWGLGTSLLPLILASAVIGIGMGIFLPSNHHLVMSLAAPGYRGTAASVIALIRNFGMLMGTALWGWFPSTPSIVLFIAATLLLVAFVCARQRNMLSLQEYLLTN
jgi:MFS family permease